MFGSAKRVAEAPVEQIAAVPGIGRTLAERIKAGLAADRHAGRPTVAVKAC